MPPGQPRPACITPALAHPLTSCQARAYVEEVLEMVDMGDLRGALVGSPGGAGLSVEQRKRLTIAVELVANPACLFMDEPTSGGWTGRRWSARVGRA
jgi:ABC-type multidrug transport system ATPase subunit